jgi:hypothetical protein
LEVEPQLRLERLIEARVDIAEDGEPGPWEKVHIQGNRADKKDQDRKEASHEAG